MANNNNIQGLVTTDNPQLIANGLSVPSTFNNSRSPGEIETLMTSGDNGDVLLSKNKLPLTDKLSYSGYVIPSTIGTTPNTTAGYFPTIRDRLYKNEYKSSLMTSEIGKTRSEFEIGLRDVVRMSRWSISTPGLMFLGKQFILQGLTAYNETKLYNPAMPILASVSKSTFGVINPPLRHIEPTLSGALGALGLRAIGGLFGVNGAPTPPKGTVGLKGLPTSGQDGGKGLIRGKTASDADRIFKQKWGSGSSMGILGMVKNFFKSNTALGTFLPVGQPDGVKFKVGENSYDVFVNDIKKKDTSILLSGATYTQAYDGSSKDNRYTAKNKSDDSDYRSKNPNGIESKIANPSNDNTEWYLNQLTKNELFVLPSKDIPPQKNTETLTQRFISGKNRYDTTNGIFIIRKRHSYSLDSEKNHSDVLSKWKQLHLDGTISNSDTPVNTRFENTDSDEISSVKDELNSLLSTIESAGEYSVVGSRSYVSKTYKDLIHIKASDKKSPLQYQGRNAVSGYEYRVADKNKRAMLRQRGIDTHQPDTINLLKVMSSDEFETSPVSSDIITFHFYDVVNDKYIPFRATVKGLQESLSADWTDVKYINRADKIYSYSGFARSLSFNFSVVVTSIKELLPTWQRINYLCGLTKPANYTGGNTYSRYIIPPLIKITIGDMYKSQPALISQIGLSIPDNAPWETLSEKHARYNDWTYLNNRIRWNNSRNKYAQFPTECELNIQLILLEKEMPHTGGSQFGDYYLDNTQVVNRGSSTTNSFSDGLYMKNVATADGAFEQYE